VVADKCRIKASQETHFCKVKFDEFVKSPTSTFTVIPAKAGIQSFQIVADHLDSGFHRSDDFLRGHQIL
jgi:hypothetical protein